MFKFLAAGGTSKLFFFVNAIQKIIAQTTCLDCIWSHNMVWWFEIQISAEAAPDYRVIAN